jgi:hypothetical protein
VSLWASTGLSGAHAKKIHDADQRIHPHNINPDTDGSIIEHGSYWQACHARWILKPEDRNGLHDHHQLFVFRVQAGETIPVVRHEMA